MRRVVNTAVTLAVVATVVGLFVVWVIHARQAGDLKQCSLKLRQLALACEAYNDTNRHFPRATVAANHLAPEKRLAWITMIVPYCEATFPELDASQAWYADANYPPWAKNSEGTMWMMGSLPFLLCAANPRVPAVANPSPTHYLGIAGLGPDAAALSLNDPRAGFFGYDRWLTPAGVQDGLSATAMLVESADGGPWTAAGHATVRGFELARQPYFGEGAQFVTAHHQGSPWSSGPGLANVAFADCSARPINGTASPGVLRAMMTVAGGEPPDLPDD